MGDNEYIDELPLFLLYIYRRNNLFPFSDTWNTVYIEVIWLSYKDMIDMCI